MKEEQWFLSLPLLILLFRCTTTVAQPAPAPTQPAPGPAPPGPTNVTKILEKGGQFTTFVKILGLTHMDDQINGQLNDSNQGMTIFAPPDNAFSGLQSGTLNALSDEQKTELIQFHVVPNFLSTSQFQTASNPLSTQAGSTGKYEFPLNITTSSGSVNISTGVVNATVTGTIYTDGQLAVYQVDKVLLPAKLFGPQPPAAAPAPPPPPAKPKKKKIAESPQTEIIKPSAAAPLSVGVHGIFRSIGLALALAIACDNGLMMAGFGLLVQCLSH